MQLYLHFKTPKNDSGFYYIKRDRSCFLLFSNILLLLLLNHWLQVLIGHGSKLPITNGSDAMVKPLESGQNHAPNDVRKERNTKGLS